MTNDNDRPTGSPEAPPLEASSRQFKNEVDPGGAPGEAIDRLAVHPGLCAGCVHLRLLTSRRSVFVLCGRAAADPAFPRYPPLPVRSCCGFEPPPTP